MTTPPAASRLERIYEDVLERAVRQAGTRVPHGEAAEVGHHVATAMVRREAMAGGEPVRELDAFVGRAVLNRLRELWRSRKRRAAAEERYERERGDVAPAWASPGADLESRELHTVVQQAIEGLPDVRRRAFLLVRRDGRSYREVADMLGIGVGTVSTHLSRANSTLRAAIAAYQDTGR